MRKMIKRFSLWKVIFIYKKSFGALPKQGDNVQLNFPPY